MPDRNEKEHKLDHTTTASICSAVGERLRRHLVPEISALPSRLQQLLDEMKRRDRETAGANPCA
jgi:hypothetical protein